MIFRGTSTIVSNFNDCLDFLMRLKPFIEKAKDFNIIVELQPKEEGNCIEEKLDVNLLAGTANEMEKITDKALKVVDSILKDFCEEDALTIIQIAKVLIEKY